MRTGNETKLQGKEQRRKEKREARPNDNIFNVYLNMILLISICKITCVSFARLYKNIKIDTSDYSYKITNIAAIIM